ncbi:MAG: tail fiber domain-containing protein, partial [Chitinophagaceae bacterium]|nr:tail fiber domain-containing protein [Chitinophagaceae bacterium]
ATGTAYNQYTLVPGVTQGFFNSFNATAPVTAALALWSPNSGSTSPNSCILTRTVNINLPEGKCLDQLMTLTLMIDDSCIITVNGGTPYRFGGGPQYNWALVHNISVPNEFVNGSNTIQIECFNLRKYYNWVIAKFIVDTVTCGSSGCQRSICQWNTDGNFISPAASNMLGTMSNDEVRLVTNSFQRGVISTNGDFGFGTATPTNRVHIRSQWGNASGLRLEDMPNTLTAITNPTNKVLSVDALGNVILVNESGGGGGSVSADNGLSLNGSSVQLGESCNNPGGAAALSDDRAIPMNFHNIIFKDPADGAGSLYNRVGIGTVNCTPIAKLQVQKTSFADEYENISILGENLSNNFRGAASIAVKGQTIGTNEDNSVLSMGGFFEAKYDQYGYGVGGFTNSADQGYGGYFSAHGKTKAYGIYASASTTFGGPTYAGYFNGEVFSTIGYITSDQRIKKNIRPMQHALDIINRLQPKTYAFDQSQYPSLHLPGKSVNYGLIAQELEQVLPTLVGSINVPEEEKDGKPAHMGNETLKVVNYVELIPILIQGMKEQQEAINTLKAQIARLEAGNTKPEAAGNSMNIELSEVPTLGQNIPNPFDHQTSIPFSIPARAQKASIRFNGPNGNLIRSIDISERGKGQLSVSAADLSAGAYTYSLVVDNRIIDTKKMMVSHE